MKLGMLLGGLAVASVGFLLLLTSVDRRAQRQQAAQAEQWGLDMARQEKLFQEWRADLHRLAALRSTNLASRSPGTVLQPALVLSESESFLLRPDGLRKVSAPIDPSSLKAVVLTVAPPPPPVEMHLNGPPSPELRVHVFSWPQRELLATEEFSGSPEPSPPANTEPVSLGISPLLSVAGRELGTPAGSRRRVAAAKLENWLTNYCLRQAGAER